MSEDCKKQILEHTIKCNKETAKDRHEFRAEIHTLFGTIDGKMDKVMEFILTSPQNFPEKKEYDEFKALTVQFQNGINQKIAYASGGFAVIIFIINKFPL